MADETQTTVETPELTIETVTAVTPEELTDDQKTFLQENNDNLTDEQRETYKDALVKKEEKEEEIDIEKLEPETRGRKTKEKEEKPEDKGGDGEDTIDPDDEKTIGKVVNKQLKPVTEALQQLQELKDQNEVDALIRVQPEYTKYREAVLKYMAHPAYANIPARNIIAIVASKDMQKLGAQKEREAAKKVKETQGNGSQQRAQAGGKRDWKGMSKEDFEAEKAKIMQRL